MTKREYCMKNPAIAYYSGLKFTGLNTALTIIFIVFPGRGMAVKLQNNITG